MLNGYEANHLRGMKHNSAAYIPGNFMIPTRYKLNSYLCYETSSVVILFYHNVYEEGKQGGLEIIQQGTRIAGNGNLRLTFAPEQWDTRPENGTPQAEHDGSSLLVNCAYPHQDIQYTVQLTPLGDSLHLTVDLAKPLPTEWAGKAGFNLELIPHLYIGKSFAIDSSIGIFPSSFCSPHLQADESHKITTAPITHGTKLSVTPEDPSTCLTIEALKDELFLLDGRGEAKNGWFIVRSLVPTEITSRAVEWLITPASNSSWMRPPVISYSQVGYHTQQRKRAVIELGPQNPRPKTARLVRIHPDGTLENVKSARPRMWGRYLYYTYTQFDFSEVTQSGIYRLEYADQITNPFPIGDNIYTDGVWQPTLDTFFPVQMCHMEVRDGYRVWHGACHLDDALQAPVNHKHFDGYTQYGETDTPFPPLTHIPYLDVGGWHDAGDYDLAAGSQASTTRQLAHTRELFGIDRDQMSVDRPNRRVMLRQPDGIPDLVQQVTHGAENLLSGYRACGHSFSGIIENSIRQYVHLGDPVTMTDNRVNEGAGSDDRWAFTNRDSATEYTVCGALAAAARVLRGWEDTLAGECLATAQKIWLYESTHPVKVARSSYTPGRAEIQAIVAAAELLVSTEDEVFQQFLVSQTSLITETIAWIGWAVAMAAPKIKNTAFQDVIRSAIKKHMEKLASEAALNPFGVPYSADTWRQQSPVWGVAWNLLSRAVDLFYMHLAFPDAVDPQIILDTLGYVLGCHPVSNLSLVSGVGSRSFTVAYGINRADWTHIPGGVISGPALLRPNYLELQEPFPFLWQQTEYVISGAANYIFCVLAANQILAETTPRQN
jgi:endoglucanase